MTIPVTGISLNVTSYTLATTTASATAVVTFSPEGTSGELTWESSDTSVFTVSDAGVMTPVTHGIGVVTVRLSSDSSIVSTASVIVGIATVGNRFSDFDSGVGFVDSNDNLYAGLGYADLSEIWKSSDLGITWERIIAMWSLIKRIFQVSLMMMIFIL